MAASPPHVLFMEDDPEQADVVRTFLQHKGYRIFWARTGDEALQALQKVGARFQAAILDIMVPPPDGLAVLRHIRQQPSLQQLPVLMLTARDRETDEITGLQQGADAYLAKPVSLARLEAHLSSLLRRQGPADDRWLHLGPLTLDTQSHELHLEGHTTPLTGTEYDLLALFMRAPARIFPREEILAQLFSEHGSVMDRTIDAHIKNLRAKLGAHAQLIKTYRGIGYGFNPQALEDEA